VRGFLAAFLMCGLLSIEWWPFTGFNMYARRVGRTRDAWQVVALDAASREHRFAFEDLPVAYRKATKRFATDGPSAEQREVCEALASALAARDALVVGVRVYLATYDVRSGDRLGRRLHHACGTPA
jgi:hypothetical protein